VALDLKAPVKFRT